MFIADKRMESNLTYASSRNDAQDHQTSHQPFIDFKKKSNKLSQAGPKRLL